FIRGGGSFPSRGQIYVKTLPNGDARQLTNAPNLKLAPTFTPDGKHVAYTLVTSSGWDTWTVPVIGGEPRPLLTNASALGWLDDARVMFSEVKRPPHLGIVTSTQARSERREIYFPAHERG